MGCLYGARRSGVQILAKVRQKVAEYSPKIGINLKNFFENEIIRSLVITIRIIYYVRVSRTVNFLKNETMI
jgi:hypothetical protein